MSYARNRSAAGFTTRGFTFIELVIALTILAILVAGSITVGRGWIGRAKVSGTKSTLQATQSSIDGYYIDVGQYPSSLTELINPPADAKLKARWKGPYWPKKDEPKDAWGNTLVYKLTKGAAHPYDLYSLGSTGEEGTVEGHIDVWEME
ncbi:type II secretion system protein GspG [Candidatus Dependentiae bacterium]|nr:type II secretion system protein GspG [Candidatus Dependentiae bacterium]